jgi:predicted lipid-binding transport protein (Tim44 family)
VSTETSVAVLAIGGALVAWIFNLVRQGRLYVGYGVIFGMAITGAAGVVGLAPILGGGAMLRAHVEGLILGAAAFVVVILVYTLSQVTLWANRLTALTQELAIRQAERPLSHDPAPAQRSQAPPATGPFTGSPQARPPHSA